MNEDYKIGDRVKLLVKIDSLFVKDGIYVIKDIAPRNSYPVHIKPKHSVHYMPVQYEEIRKYKFKIL